MRMVEVPAHAAVEERIMIMSMYERLSENERERFVRTMSQKKLGELDEAIDDLASAKYFLGFLSRPDGDPDLRDWYDREASDALKRASRILLELSEAIAEVREAESLPTETRYWEQQKK